MRHKPQKAWLGACAVPALLLSACDKADDAQTGEADTGDAPQAAEFVEPLVKGEGTPMQDRVATLGFLNKRNGITQDLEMKPGETRRIGPAIVRLQACERTAPWEPRPETGAFVQLLVETRVSRDEDPKWLRVFSGWLFKESPSVNVVEHPIYDVWVKDCAMRFPGEEDAPRPAPSPSTSPSALTPPTSSENASGNDSEGASTPAAPAEAPPATASEEGE